MTYRRRDSEHQYPGDHEDKQAARMILYRHALLAPIQGHAVTLAGTEPESEVQLMRDYLKWPTHRAWFVDFDAKNLAVQNALQRIKKSWPGVNTRMVDLADLAPKLGALGFANLDFMGAPLQEANLRCMRSVIDNLMSGAVLGMTWLKGREDFRIHKSARLLWSLGKGFRGNERRWAGVQRAVEFLSDGTLPMIDRWEYCSRHSPMCIAVFKKE